MEEYQEEVSDVSHDKAVLDKYSKEWELEQMSLERELIGEKKGLEQGISQKAREVAETMLQNGYDISEVIKISKLTKKEIKEIKKDLKI